MKQLEERIARNDIYRSLYTIPENEENNKHFNNTQKQGCTLPLLFVCLVNVTIALNNKNKYPGLPAPFRKIWYIKININHLPKATESLSFCLFY